MKAYGIYTRNQAGTTIYYIGVFETAEQAKQDAITNYRWYAVDPIHPIIEIES